jgi:hypothetical protein
MAKQRKPAPERQSGTDPAHAPGKRRLPRPPDDQRAPKTATARSSRNQPWVPTSSLVGRKRRSPHG